MNSTSIAVPRQAWWRRPWGIAASLLLAILLLVTWQQARTAWTIGVAYRYALPLYEVMRVRYATLSDPANPRRVAVNSFVHRRRLADHGDRLVTTPNNDTLYSLAVLDLSAGPVRLDVPDSGGRYYSAALMDAYTNNFSIIGRRTTGTRAGSYLIAGPGWEHDSPDGGMQVIHAPTPTVLLLVRILVDGPDDVDAVIALQDHFRLSAPKPDKAGPAAPVPLANDAARFVAVVDRALADNPPPSDDAAMLARLEQVGVAPGDGALDPSLTAAWKRDFPLAQKLLARAVARPRQLNQGWSYLPADIGNFGTDYDVRAAVALVGLLALPPEEAMYANSLRDAQDREFSGAHRYRLHLPRGGVPAEAFWSLSMYEAEPDGRAFFADNPLHRYAIGDRTPGLAHNADGSLDILIQHQPPPQGERGNWLPAPAGAFRLAMRAYQPKRELLDGSFRYPGVERLD